MAKVRITTFTDPACPFAYSAEPIRLRLMWRFRDQIDWHLRVVGLSKDGSSYAKKGFTKERAARNLDRFHAYGQPLYQGSERPVSATWPVCKAIVAARINAGQLKSMQLMRDLQRQHLAEGRDLSNPQTLSLSLKNVGFDEAEFATWLADPRVQTEFENDLSLARRPSPAALAMIVKLAPTGEDWTADSKGPMASHRYTCPSYVIESLDGETKGLTLEAPGFHSSLTVETLVANVAPHLNTYEWTKDPVEIARFFGEQLTTQEVAAVMNREDARDAARRSLSSCGLRETVMGSDSVWQL